MPKQDEDELPGMDSASVVELQAAKSGRHFLLISVIHSKLIQYIGNATTPSEKGGEDYKPFDQLIGPNIDPVKRAHHFFLDVALKGLEL